MFNILKKFIKRKLTASQWNTLRLILLPLLQILRKFLNIILYIFFWLLPVGFIKSFNRRKNIVLFYDLRVSTYRFDVVTALLAAAVNVNVGKGKKFDLVVFDPRRGRRSDGPLSANDSDSVRLHYLTSVIFESLNVTGHVDEIYYLRSRNRFSRFG